MSNLSLKDNTKIHIVLTASSIHTPLGEMIMISDEHALYLLEFVERKNLDRELEKLQNYTRSKIEFGNTHPLDSIKQELSQYFAGELKQFNTPIHLLGSPFQLSAWNALMQVPYGTTLSYGHQARLMGMPTASRAVARANSMNHLAIIIPCHRIINSNDGLGGYAGGIERKSWLLNHEKR